MVVSAAATAAGAGAAVGAGAGVAAARARMNQLLIKQGSSHHIGCVPCSR
jgi:hypothetical protein